MRYSSSEKEAFIAVAKEKGVLETIETLGYPGTNMAYRWMKGAASVNSPVHRLIEYDDKAGIGVCSHCAEVRVVYDRGSWSCAIARRDTGRRQWQTARNKLLLLQDYRCAICRAEVDEKTAQLDHNHSCCKTKSSRSCGKCYRGVLCKRCNLGLGWLDDNTENMRRAIAYLTDGPLAF